MKVITEKTYVFDEKEIKDLIRRHIIDKFQSTMVIIDNDIKLSCSVSHDDIPYDFTATFKVKIETEK